MKKLMVGGWLLVVGCCPFCRCCNDGITAVSPDGKNEIRLWTNPLAYEVTRGGTVMIAKTEIGMKIDGKCLAKDAPAPKVTKRTLEGTLRTPVYKKQQIDLSGNETWVDFGDWGIRLAARNDGVAYRFETMKPGQITVDCEKATVTMPCEAAKATVHRTTKVGCEETPSKSGLANAMTTAKNEMIYLPAVFRNGRKTVVVTDADVFDYPIWNLVQGERVKGERVKGERAKFDSFFAAYPTETYRSGMDGWDRSKPCEMRARWEVVRKSADYLVKTDGTRTFPWRAFVLADRPRQLLESDLVMALSRPQAADADFSWVKPGKVTWEWWNAWDNVGDPLLKGAKDGCTTEVYRRFFDLAAEYGVEYVIFDEGWSQKLNIWKLNEKVDLKGLIDYGNAKGVGTILWMAWGQIVGDEERVAREFAKMGVKGFKVDFMDRGDAQCERFYWDFAKACAKYRLVVDYHGAHRPTGLSRAYPNVLNFEGVHGLETMKFYNGADILANDVAIAYTRMTAGQMDYTPGAMNNYPVGRYPDKKSGRDMYTNPGSMGTRVRQMAMMAVYEAPLQMLCDSVKNYRANTECFAFMAKTPVVWDDTVGLSGCPRSLVAVARKAKDGSWYAAAISDSKARDFELDTSFLGEGVWKAEIFRDADDAATAPEHYVHERGVAVKPGEKINVRMAPGGGYIVRFTK